MTTAPPEARTRVSIKHPVDQVLPPQKLAIYGFQHVLVVGHQRHRFLTPFGLPSKHLLPGLPVAEECFQLLLHFLERAADQR